MSRNVNVPDKAVVLVLTQKQANALLKVVERNSLDVPLPLIHKIQQANGLVREDKDA